MDATLRDHPYIEFGVRIGHDFILKPMIEVDRDILRESSPKVGRKLYAAG